MVRALVGLVVVVVSALLSGCGDAPPDDAEPAPGRHGDVLVGSAACVECHADEHATWSETLHAHTFVPATDDVVLGRFDGVPVDHGDLVVTPYRLDAELRMRVEGSLVGGSDDHRVDYAVGRGFEQGYLTEDDAGALRLLPLSWNVAHERWDATHHVLLDITGLEASGHTEDVRNLVFNEGCAHCHATGFDAGHDLETGRFDSHWPEGSISCESCHGKGGRHVDWHRNGLGSMDDATLLHPGRDLDARQVAESCGRCHYLHEWRYALDPDPTVGHHEIAVSRHFARVGFLPDGRLAGLSYHGTTQSRSPCFTEGGMSCLHCHDLHGTRPMAMRYDDGSAEMCAGCHQDLVDDPDAHSFHGMAPEVGCLDCHMPRHLTGVLSFQRDHSLRSPEPALTIELGEELAPNACNLCHTDQDAAWADEWRTKWWGPTSPELVASTRFVQRVQERRETREEVVRRALDQDEDRFVRLTAVNALARHDAVAELGALLQDDDVEVRQLAVEGLVELPDRASEPALLDALSDDVRTVRIEAAYALGRRGWRGDVSPLAPDVATLLARQAPSLPTLDRFLVLADLLDDGEAFDRAWPAWRRSLAWPAPRWSAIELDLVARRARRDLDVGRVEDARLLLVHALGRAGGDPVPLMRLDLAEARRRSGDAAGADAVLEALLETGADAAARSIALRRLGREARSPDESEWTGELRRRAD